METLFSSVPILSSKPLFPKYPAILHLAKPTTISFLKKPIQSSPKSVSSHNKDWFSALHQGLAAAAISIAINFCPLPTSAGFATASEFDVLSEGPPKESYVVDDAGVLSRVTKSDLKRLLSDLESRKNLHINFITVRKLTSNADAFEYADQLLEKWYPTVEEGNNKGIVVLVTAQKEGAITGGPAFVQAVGDGVLDAIVSENLPGGDAARRERRFGGGINHWSPQSKEGGGSDNRRHPQTTVVSLTIIEPAILVGPICSAPGLADRWWPNKL